MDFKKRLIEELGLSQLQVDTLYNDYVTACEKLAKEYHTEQLRLCGVVKSLPSDEELGDKLNKYVLRKSLDTESVYTETDAYIDVYKLAKEELSQPK